MICRVCKKPITKIDLSPSNLISNRFICVPCSNTYKRNWCNENIDKSRDSGRERMKKWRLINDPTGDIGRRKRREQYQKNKEVIKVKTKEYYQNNPLKIKARRAVSNKKIWGNLKEQPCEVCGTNERLNAHHPDYNKPLEITWLCAKHHKEVHSESV